ncbi:hypothetical protein AB0I28_29915 [Phytomonospora sp. NPDC050363]|uniref:hypothetical protein n=1 Tax=Phytomonospora sp. NPDC050363 TaxID=3155642 RepID=UPI00340FB00B
MAGTVEPSSPSAIDGESLMVSWIRMLAAALKEKFSAVSSTGMRWASRAHWAEAVSPPRSAAVKALTPSARPISPLSGDSSPSRMRPKATAYRGVLVEGGPEGAGARSRAVGPSIRAVGPSIGPGSAMIALCTRAVNSGWATLVSTTPRTGPPWRKTRGVARGVVAGAAHR